MCAEAIINGVWCDTVRDLRNRGVVVIKDARWKEMPPPDSCLCGVDLAASARASGMVVQKYDATNDEWHIVRE